MFPPLDKSLSFHDFHILKFGDAADLCITEKAHSKIGSLDKVHHSPGGGDVHIESHKLEFKDKAAPRIGSLEKAGHTPSGGNVQVSRC